MEVEAAFFGDLEMIDQNFRRVPLVWAGALKILGAGGFVVNPFF